VQRRLGRQRGYHHEIGVLWIDGRDHFGCQRNGLRDGHRKSAPLQHLREHRPHNLVGFVVRREAPLSIPPPMSNAERQRRFQAAHPGYDRRRKARQRAAAKRVEAQHRAERLRAAQAAEATPQTLALPAPVQVMLIPVPATRLLPAPVEVPALAAIDELRARLQAAHAHQPARDR
jgi:hypothetical protein